MEAERRSTVSSLKGQLSNVEGSVKSMKVAVVVGSVLTVACLAAVFGVTVLANEVSKEVKVSNGVLATKSGNTVLTTSTKMVTKVEEGDLVQFVAFHANNKACVANVETVVGNVFFGQDVVISESKVTFTKGSMFASLVEDETEDRKVNAWAWLAGGLGGSGADAAGVGEASKGAGEVVGEAIGGMINDFTDPNGGPFEPKFPTGPKI